MDASGFGTFVPFGEIAPGTLFLDHAPGGATETAILFKVVDPEHNQGCIRIFDSALIGTGVQTPSLALPLRADKPVIALPEYRVEIENSVDNILWESDADFIKAVMLADESGGLSLKAYGNRGGGTCRLFNLATGAPADMACAAVGFRRWSIARRNSHGERIEIFRFEV